MKYLRAPFLSTNFSKEGKKVKNRFDNILFSNGKKTSTKILVIPLTALIAIGTLVGCSDSTAVIGGADGPTAIYVSKSDYISQAILNTNASGYMPSECQAEGHIVLETENTDDGSIVYALVTYGEYGFENGNFVKVAGSGVIPTKLTFDKNQLITNYEVPEDGSRYDESLKELFPKHLYEKALMTSSSDYEACKKQEKEYAKAYLDSIGRSDAQIGDYSDFEHKLLTTDYGVSVEFSNELISKKELASYPMEVGNREQLEDGVRYVYETRFEGTSGDNGQIIYEKYAYDTKETAEKIVFEIKDGKMTELK